MTTHTPVAPKIMLVGDTGTGKTYALRTLIAAGITPFIIAFEYPDILEDLPADKCHWHYIPPAMPKWDVLLDNAKKITLYSNEALQKLPGLNKDKYTQWYEVLNTCANFKCDRDGKEYGDVAEWGADRALIIDGLSGLSIVSMDLAIGAKPVISQPDWGTAMGNLERFHNVCCTALKCWYILIAHLEPEKDEVSGGVVLMASTLGKKLAPKLPRPLTDIIHAKRTGTDFTWSTISPNVALKARNLPLSDKLRPDFGQIATTWRARQPK